MNAAKVTKDITVNGVSATIRKLSGRHLEESRESRRVQRLEAYRKFLSFQREFLATVTTTATGTTEEKAPAAVEVTNPLEDFDPYVLIQRGLVSVASGEAITVEFVEDFDEDTVILVATEVLRLAVPRLFQSADEAAVARKND